MTIRRFSRLQPGDMPSAAELGQLFQDVERLNLLRPVPPLYMDDTPGGPLLRYEGPIVVFILITGPQDPTTGWYPALEQFYDVQTQTWRDGDICWWADVNA